MTERETLEDAALTQGGAWAGVQLVTSKVASTNRKSMWTHHSRLPCVAGTVLKTRHATTRDCRTIDGICALLAGTAGAQEESEVRTHDGLYLRLGIGPGYAFGKNELDDANVKADVKGFAVSTELAIGGTLAPGLVLGVGSYSMVVPSPTYSSDTGPDVDVGTHHVSGLGPFIDYYFDPHGGAHAELGLLLSAIYIQKKDQQEAASGAGFGAVLGGGYEFWIGEQWSMGPVFRIATYRDKVEGSDTNVKSTLSLWAPSVLFGATYH